MQTSTRLVRLPIALAATLAVAAAALAVAAAAPHPLSAAQPAARTIEIQVGDNMKFTPNEIAAKPGERLHVVLKDTGVMPKTAMAHNFIVLKKGANAKAFVEKSQTARATDFIAPEVKDQILANTSLVGPGETVDVTFTAPPVGTYTFICSFPGHYAVGMKGTLTVK